MTAQVNSASLFGKAISRGKSPKVPSLLGVPLNFVNNTDVICSVNVLHGLPNVSGISGIQSVYIDNSNNASTTSLAFDNGPVYTCPSFAQAIFPIFFSGEVLSFKATSAGGVLVPTYFLNTREQAQLWSAKIPIAGIVNVTGSDVFTQPFSGLFVDASQTLAVAATSQLLLPASSARQILGIRNPGTAQSQGIAAPEPVYINFGAAAAVAGPTSWELFPGEQLPQFLMTTSQAIFWTATTLGHALIAKYM